MARRHALSVPAPPAEVFRVLAELDLAELPIGRALLWLRGYGRRRSSPRRLLARVVEFGFVPLGERPGSELVFGIAGKFWRPDGSLRRLTAEEFARFEEPGFAKAAWNVAVAEDGRGATLLSTETRVLCFGARARSLFRLYWTLIEPFSGLIRLELLKRVRARVAQEKRRSRA